MWGSQSSLGSSDGSSASHLWRNGETGILVHSAQQMVDVVHHLVCLGGHISQRVVQLEIGLLGLDNWDVLSRDNIELFVIDILIGRVAGAVECKTSGPIHKIMSSLVGFGRHDVVVVNEDVIFLVHELEMDMDGIWRFPHLDVNTVDLLGEATPFSAKFPNIYLLEFTVTVDLVILYFDFHSHFRRSGTALFT
mgnify:CR=1 FL=1